MIGKPHFRVRGVKCGKCSRIHTWYKYRVWREGKKIKEEYIGKCDADGNDEYIDPDKYWYRAWGQRDKQREQSHTGQQSRKPPPQQRTRSPYEILGVSYTATQAEINKAYRALVKKYHPDINKQADPGVIVEINVAYHILTK